MLSVYLRGNEAPRHPRIFKKRIRRADAGIRPGDVVAVRTEDGTFVGRAFYSPRSVIAARILDREEHGPPVDRDWFAARIGGAAALRKALRLDDVTDAYRVVHAEGDGLGGLIVDRPTWPRSSRSTASGSTSTAAAATRPASSSISARRATRSLRWRRAAACSTSAATPAASPWRRRAAAPPR
jgi:23S rRNA G2069 N7-methylase RlmK/C1962 C5-methylase RlmI